MAAWDIDLTTRAGARSGAYQASLVCLLMAGLTAVGLVFLGGLGMNLTTPIGKLALGLSLVQLAVLVVAGLRLRAGKGFFWGLGAVAVMVLTLIGNLIGGALGAAGLDVLLLLFLGNGLRGALALHRNKGFEDDDLDVFE